MLVRVNKMDNTKDNDDEDEDDDCFCYYRVSLFSSLYVIDRWYACSC